MNVPSSLAGSPLTAASPPMEMMYGAAKLFAMYSVDEVVQGDAGESELESFQFERSRWRIHNHGRNRNGSRDFGIDEKLKLAGSKLGAIVYQAVQIGAAVLLALLDFKIEDSRPADLGLEGT